MITYVRTNIFESNAQVLVNTVNTVGVMGKGLAKEFKRIYPEMFEAYQKYCEDSSLTVGKLQIFRTSNKWVLNFPTKTSWRNPSKLEYIEQGLQKFVANYERQGIRSISFPMLGCGNGGLPWEEVKPIMEKYFKNLPIDIFIHIAKKDEFQPEHRNKKAIDKWLQSDPNYLSSIEFVAHLEQRYSGLINTVNQHGTMFEVSVEEIDNIKTFCLKRDEILLCLDEPTLTSIWQTLRDNGILKREMLSSELAEYSEMVMLFLSELDYMVLTEVGDDKGEMAVRLLSHNQPIDNSEEVLFVA